MGWSEDFERLINDMKSSYNVLDEQDFLKSYEKVILERKERLKKAKIMERFNKLKDKLKDR